MLRTTYNVQCTDATKGTGGCDADSRVHSGLEIREIEVVKPRAKTAVSRLSAVVAVQYRDGEKSIFSIFYR